MVKLNQSYSYTWPTLPSMLTARKRMHCCIHMLFHIIFPYHADTRHASYPSKQTVRCSSIQTILGLVLHNVQPPIKPSRYEVDVFLCHILHFLEWRILQTSNTKHFACDLGPHNSHRPLAEVNLGEGWDLDQMLRPTASKDNSSRCGRVDRAH